MNTMRVGRVLPRAFVASAVNRLCAAGFCLTVVFTTFAVAEESDPEFWLRQAESACREIEDLDASDRAFSRLHAVYLQFGDSAKAEKITNRIQNGEKRVKAHIALARHYAASGNVERCTLELNQARPFEINSLVRDDLVEAYLRFADSPSFAISYITEQHGDQKARENLCEALARHGHLDEALKIAANEKDVGDQSTLKFKTALAAASAARIADTERAIEQLATSTAAERYKQSIWCALAKALYRKEDMESAVKYAALVTDKYTIRTNRDLRRIMTGVPPDAAYVSTSRPKQNGTLFYESSQTGDPGEAIRRVGAAIANAEKNPVKATTGQFGPWNQTAQLAKLRLEYAYVAALYRKAGKQDEATTATEIVEEAIQTLVKESGFIAMLELSKLYHMQLKMDDIDGLKRSTAVTDPSVWLNWSGPIVSKVLSSGDVDGAKEIARRALSAKTGFGRLPSSDRIAVISSFIEAEEALAAHELVRTSEPVEITAAACENAGRTMIKTDRGQLLQTSEWRNGIGAFQRAHLSIGAAIMAKEKSKAN